MSQLYVTGPALFYVGIPVVWTDVLQFISQAQQGILQPNFPQPVQAILGGGGGGDTDFSSSGADFGPAAGAPLQNNQVPPPAALPAPITIFIEQLSTAYVPVYLGTGETPPTIEILASWDGLETDSGGTENPSERLAEGEEAIITADFTRFNEAVYEAVAARSQTNAFLGRFSGWSQIGKAMALEKLTFPLWVVFPYSAKPVYGLAGQPFGYRFYQAFLESPDRLQVGSLPRVTGLQFRAQRLLQLIESTSALMQPINNYVDIPNPSPLLPVGQVFTLDADQSIGGLYDFSIVGLPKPD